MADLQNTAANTANATTTGTDSNGDDDADDARTLTQQANAMLFVAALQKDVNLRNNWTSLLQKMNDELKVTTPADKDKVYQEKISIIDNWLVNQGYFCQAEQVLALLKTPFYQDYLKESQPNADSDRFVQTTLSDVSLYNAWLGALKAVSGGADTDTLNTFLTSRGYNCTYVQVNASFVKMRNHNMNYWTGIYANSTLTHGSDKPVAGPILIIYGDYNVSIDNLHLDKELNKVQYNNGVLTWEADDFTISYSGKITFSQKVMATTADPYVGNEYFGTITYPASGTAPQQGEVQVFGRIGELTQDQKDKKIPPAVNPSVVDQAMKYIGYFMAGVFLIDFAASIPKRFKSIKEFAETVKEKLKSKPDEQVENDLNQMDEDVQSRNTDLNEGESFASDLHEAPLNEGNINGSDVIQDLQNELANSPSPERTQELEQQMEEQQQAEEEYDNEANEEANPEEEGGWGEDLESIFEV
ncbi:MAG TPA: hypothetical protein VFV52_16165 [Bacilli bacterium]|nr:hypothetical protein [Bacilli bacterium]